MTHTPLAEPAPLPLGGERLLAAPDVSRVDAAAQALGVSLDTLISRAGGALAEITLQAAAARGAPLWRSGRVLVLAGPGLNGADGYEAAARLIAAGAEVSIAPLLPPGPPAAAAAAARAQDAGAATIAWADAADLDRDGLVVIDALFGAGLTRPLPEAAQALARSFAQAAPALTVAADLPSGLHGDSGRALGAAFRADVTAAFTALKPGHLIGEGPALSGRVEAVQAVLSGAERALDAATGPATAWARPLGAAAPDWTRRLMKDPGAHKYVSGAVLVGSGGFGASGAARLAARAALRIGAGLVTVAAPPEAMAECAAQLTAIMLREADTPDALAALLEPMRIGAAVYGPGAAVPEPPGPLIQAAALALLAGAPDGTRVILDADALSCWGDAPQTLFAALKSREAILTPHMGEAARLFPDLANRFEQDPTFGKLAYARAAAARAAAVVLLKGPDTVVAAPDGRAVLLSALADRAVPDLATAGSGDVLAGLIAGLAAARGRRRFSLFEAAAAGAWLHAELGRALGPGLIAEDLPEAAPALLRALHARLSDR